jgi:TctA family transporter
MIKSDGDPWVFFTRPIAMWLAFATLVIVLWPIARWVIAKQRRVLPA